MFVSEEEYVSGRAKIEKKWLDLAEEYTRQMVNAMEWSCKHFDAQELIAMWLKKNTVLKGVNETSYNCFRCGHQLIIGNNWMASEVGLVDEDSSDEFMVTSLTCPHCGAGYEVYDTPKSEQDNYDYFKEGEKETCQEA